MKTQIRQGIFETNSSSVHSLSLTSLDTYNKWTYGEILFNMSKNDFLPKDEAEKFNEEHIEKWNFPHDWKEDSYYVTKLYVDYNTFCDAVYRNGDIIEDTLKINNANVAAISVYIYE